MRAQPQAAPTNISGTAASAPTETPQIGSDDLALAVFNSLPAQVAIVESNGVIIAVNQSWEHGPGENPLLSRECVPGFNYFAFCATVPGEHQTTGHALVAGARHVLAGSQPDFHLEYRYCAALQRRWFSIRLTRLAAPGRNRVVVTLQEITALKAAEEERALLSTAIEQAAESVVITDRAGMILYVNPAFEKTTGYSRREAIGQNPRILKSGRHDGAFYKNMWDTLQQGETWHGKFVNVRKDGKPYTESATISPIRNSQGEIEHYVALKLDITREARLEEQFLQAQKLESVGRLTSGVAHDFNNMLSVVIMQCELAALSENLAPEVHDAIKEIRTAAQRASNLTRQLLLFSRQQLMQPHLLDLNDEVASLSKMLRRIIGEDVKLDLRLPSSPIGVRADATMLDQLLLNLAVNARDAMPNGGRLLIETGIKSVDEEVARAHGHEAGGLYAWLCVSDSGCGIPKDILPKIFDPFFTTKEPGKGTGLGLATVFGIVQQHKGWITVYSEPGRGTNFQVFLPLSDVQPKAADAKAAAAQISQGTETILLVEDDHILRSVTRATLEKNGYQVHEAASGREGLQIWQQHGSSIDLLLTDMVMPEGMTGRQLAEEIKVRSPNLKVIYTSGYSAEMSGVELALHEGESFLQKPFSRLELLELVRAKIFHRASR